MASLSSASAHMTLALVFSLPLLNAPLSAQDDTQHEVLDALEWREIGPANMGGRVTGIAGIPGNPNIFYVGGADGGVFRTTNAGVTFDVLFTDQQVYSVGALAIAPSDVNVIWLGSGEGDPRNSVSYGNGVYRSLNAGDTWTHLGLDGTERIKRIVVDPRDPDVAFVCALGREWGPNEERGVFKTTDGQTVQIGPESLSRFRPDKTQQSHRPFQTRTSLSECRSETKGPEKFKRGGALEPRLRIGVYQSRLAL